MRTIYSIDKDSIFSGGVLEIGPKGGRPFGWITAETPPPDGLAQWNGNGWTVLDQRPPPPAPTASDVITERQRRLAAGFTYDFTDARGVHTIGTTEADMNGWDEVSKAASALVALGSPDQAISIVTDTGPCDVTAIEWQSVLVSAMQFRQPIFAASFVLQSSDPIPQDYTDDVNW
jgi:hypothetical protein